MREGLGGEVPSLTVGVQAGRWVLRNEAIGRVSCLFLMGCAALGQILALALEALLVAFLIPLAAFLLDFDERLVELEDLALMAGGVARHEVELLRVFQERLRLGGGPISVGFAGVGRGLFGDALRGQFKKQIGFDGSGAIELPLRVGERLSESGLEFAFGAEVGDEARGTLKVGFEVGFVADQDLPGEVVAARVEFAALLAGLGAGSGGELRVRAIDFGAGRRFHGVLLRGKLCFRYDGTPGFCRNLGWFRGFVEGVGDRVSIFAVLDHRQGGLCYWRRIRLLTRAVRLGCREDPCLSQRFALLRSGLC